MTDPRRVRTPVFLGHLKFGEEPSLANFERLPNPRISAEHVLAAQQMSTMPAAPPRAPARSPRAAAPRPPSPDATAPMPEASKSHRAAAPAPLPPASPGAAIPPPALSAPSMLAAMGVVSRSDPQASQKVDAAVDKLRMLGSRLAEQARSDALEIGFQVARRILELELSSSPEPLFALVRSAIKRLGDARRLVIRVRPEDADQINTDEGRTRLGLSLMQVEVVPDASLEHGDCIVESDSAMVDGRIATRLDELKRAVETATVEGAP